MSKRPLPHPSITRARAGYDFGWQVRDEDLCDTAAATDLRADLARIAPMCSAAGRDAAARLILLGGTTIGWREAAFGDLVLSLRSAFEAGFDERLQEENKR